MRNLNRFFAPNVLAVAIAAAVSGCGSDSSGSPNANSGNEGEGMVYTLCHDANLNGSCDESESPQSFETQESALAATADNGSGPVIVSKSGGALLVADGAGDTASLWSTLLYNEQFFNPEATDETSIAAYLSDKLGLQESSVTAEDLAAFNASVSAAVAAFPNDNPYVVLAGVIDAAVIQGSLENALPSAAQLAGLKVLDREFTTELEATTKASWETSDGDERVQQIVVSDGTVMVVNRWFNRIAFADASTTEQTIETQPFAAMYTAGHHSYSTDDNYVSGASEHRIIQSWLADSGETLYALVSGPSEVDVPEDDSYGLFKVPMSGGQFPTEMVESVDGTAQLNVPHRAASVKRVANKSLDNALQLPDGNILAYDSGSGYVRFYSADLTEDTAKAFPLDNNLVDWSLAAEGEILVTLQGGDAPILQTYNPSDLSEVASLELPAGSDILLAAEASSRVVVVQDTVAHVINLSDLTIGTSISLAGSPASTSQLSIDGLRAALVFGGNINVLNLSEALPFVEGSIAYSSTLRALAFNGSDEILYSNSGGELSSIALADAMSAPKSIDVLMADAMAAVDEDSLNHGFDLDAVINKLAMPANYSAVDYVWEVSNGNVVADGSDNQGAVTQSAIGGAMLTDTVDVTGKYTFRGATDTSETKSFDISIRPATETRTPTVTTMTGGLEGRYIALMDANAEGSQLATWFTLSDSGDPAGLVIFSVDGNNTVTADNATPIELPSAYAASTVRGLVFSGSNIYVVLAEGKASSTEVSDGIGRVLTYNGTSWSSELALDGIVRNKGVSLSADRSVMSIAQDTTPADAESGTTEVVVFNTATLAPVSRIYTDQDATGTRYPALALSNDGQKLMGYTRGSARELHYYNAATAATAEVKALATSGISVTTFGVGYDDANDVFFAGDHNAELKIFSNASNSDWSDPVVFETSRGAWNGTETVSGGGRMYDAAFGNGVAYLWARYQGITAIDISDAANPKELFWAPLEHQWRYANALSGNGSLLFSHAYSGDDGYSAIAIVAAD